MDKLLTKEDEAAYERDVAVANDNSSHDLRFGIRGWRPDCLQRFNDPKWFLICLSVFSLCQAIVISGFVIASISTIEREFGFSSRQSGIILAANDLSGLLSVPMISFFCSSKRPKWIACGSLFCGIGALLFTLPKLIVGAYEPTIVNGGVSSLAVCVPRVNITTSGALQAICGSKAFNVESISLMVFIMAQIVMGIGAAPLYSLGPAYIDENVDPKLSPIYLGIWWATTFLGPGLGLVLGGSFLRIYVDIKQVCCCCVQIITCFDRWFNSCFDLSLSLVFAFIKPVGSNLSIRDPQWLGAWWLSFFSLAWIILLNAAVLLCYPTKINRSRRKRDEAIRNGHLPNEDKDIKMTLRGMGRATLSLLQNKTFIFAVLALTVRTMYGVGFGSFFAKLIIIKFGLGADKAGMVLGVVLIPAMTIGVMFGAYVMKRIQLRSSARWASAICLGCSVFSCLTSPLFMIPGCNESSIAGVKQPYNNSSLVMGNLRAACNNGCGCSRAAFLPLCGSDGVTYYSPCYAGCSGVISKTIFTNCTCIGSASSMVSGNGTAVSTIRTASRRGMGTAQVGFCDRKCRNLVLFLALSVVMIVASFFSGTPHNMIILRSVPANQRAYALGLQFFFMRGLSFIPGPLIAGSIIDGACKLWGVSRCGRRTNCYDYKTDTLSSSIAIFAASTSVGGMVLYFISWYFSKHIDLASPDENTAGFDTTCNAECERSKYDNANTAL